MNSRPQLRSRIHGIWKQTTCATRVFILPLFSRNFDDRWVKKYTDLSVMHNVEIHQVWIYRSLIIIPKVSTVPLKDAHNWVRLQILMSIDLHVTWYQDGHHVGKVPLTCYLFWEQSDMAVWYRESWTPMFFKQLNLVSFCSLFFFNSRMLPLLSYT